MHDTNHDLLMCKNCYAWYDHPSHACRHALKTIHDFHGVTILCSLGGKPAALSATLCYVVSIATWWPSAMSIFRCEHHLNESWLLLGCNMHYFLGNINTSNIKCVWLGFGGCLWILVHLTPELRLVRTKNLGVSISAKRSQLEVFVQNCAISNKNAFLCHPGRQKVRILCFPSFQFELLLNQKITQPGARRRPDPAASPFRPTSPPLFECLRPSTPIKKVVTLCLEICCLMAFPTQRNSHC